jgi:hypothetical protein
LCALECVTAALPSLSAEILIAGLLVVVSGLSALARYLSVPCPIVLVIGGALFGFVPGLPEVKLDTEVVAHDRVLSVLEVVHD